MNLPIHHAMKPGLPFVLGLLVLLGGGACSSSTTYGDPEGVETIDDTFGSTDLLMIAQKMAESFTSTNVWEQDRPTIVFGGIRNRTRQHIDTTNITDTIRTRLIQSGKFTVLAGGQGISEIQQEVDYQQSGAVDQAAAVELGKQLGARYVLYGRFTEIKKEDSDTRDRWYKFTLNAVDVQTRVIIWAEEKTFRKTTEKPLLGW